MYGLTIADSTERDIEKDTSGFVAYTYFSTHSSIRAKAIDMIRHKMKVKINDILVEDIFMILENDLLSHDYDPDRAYNADVGVQMSIENYILRRCTYAISTYLRKEQLDKSLNVKDEIGVAHAIPINVVSLNATISTSNDSEANLSDIIPDPKENVADVAFETCEPDKAMTDLIERITRLAAWSDTNIDVVLYATLLLDILCEEDVDRNDILKQALTALGITNYISAKQFAHSQDFIDICSDVANIEDKELFVSILSHNIFCVKQITATLEWIAEEANKRQV